MDTPHERVPLQTGMMKQGVVDKLLSDIFDAGAELQERGVLDWAGVDFRNRTAFDAALPVPEFEQTGNGTSVYEVGCHVYFFSGLWYPTGPSNATYQYDAGVQGFVRVGSGYLTAEPLIIGDLASERFGQRSRVLSELSVDLTSQSLEIYIAAEEGKGVDAAPPVERRVSESIFGGDVLRRVPDSAMLFSLLRRNTHTAMAFTRTEIADAVRYEVKTSSVSLGSTRAPDQVDSWVVDLEMESFYVAIDEKVHPSSARFIADVMGVRLEPLSLASLGATVCPALTLRPPPLSCATCLQLCALPALDTRKVIFFALGLSVYSVIVGPTNILFLGVIFGRQQSRSGPSSEGADAENAPGGGGGHAGPDVAEPGESLGIALDYGIRRRPG
jgi:hypothetical protein